jgi:LysR family transcriptional activator of nhaA
VVRAAEVLHLTPQTISGQLKLLEETIGEPLFQRVGRGLVLTDSGRLVQQYADEIFSLGAELTQRIKSKQPGAPIAFNVGIVNSIPKLIAHHILEPVLNLDEQVRVVCLENDLEKLLGDLAVHRLDLVLSDRPIPAGLSVRAYNHELGASDVAFFARKEVAARYRDGFPASLNQAPMLLPLKTSMLRRNLDDWFEHNGLIPRVIAEFDDSALLKVFGESGVGVFPAPTVIGHDIESMYRSEKIGEVTGVTERFYAISPERKIRHPAVASITETARGELFS